MARKSIYEYTINGNRASFAFTNGDLITINRDDLPAEVQEQAFWHGIKQKVADAAAIPCDPETGRPAALQDKIEAMREVAERLVTSWNAQAGTGGGNAGGWLLKALMVLYPAKSREALQTYLAGKSDKEKAALRADAKVAPIIAELKAAAGRAGSEIDTDSLMAELDD